MLATASARVATVNDVRARRRVRSVTDLRTEAASISAASVRDDDAVADRDHDGRVRRARGRASRTGSSCPRRSAARATRTSRPPSRSRGCRRLVTHNQPRVGRERARDRDALLLAARELGREMVELVSQPDQPRLWRARAKRSASSRGAQVERQDHVLERRERRQQLEELEDDPDVGPRQTASSSSPSWSMRRPSTATVPAVGRSMP